MTNYDNFSHKSEKTFSATLCYGWPSFPLAKRRISFAAAQPKLRAIQLAMPATCAIRASDYSLVGKDSALAIEKGLAEADWYACPVPKAEMRKLLERRNWPAVRDTLIWFTLLFAFGAWGIAWWGHWWAILPFMLYGVVYASSSDARWHESSHGTPFKTDWLNNALYEVASFMVLRESTPWRWSHTRHHSDTSIVGRDPEIAVPRPPDLAALCLGFFNLKAFGVYGRNVLLHCTGRLAPEELTYIPADRHRGVFIRARIYLLIYAGVIGSCFYLHSILPLMFIGLPNLYGAWLMPVYGLTQHAGLAEDVLDHRLNCRTVHMNLANRFLYWNMNYHLEHHMFPLVPYHALPRLHQLVRHDCPPPYEGLFEAYREIIPAVLRQIKDPAYYVRRPLPTPGQRKAGQQTGDIIAHKGGRPAANGWIKIGASNLLQREDVIRFDHEGRTYAIYRTLDDEHYATDGICTHGNAHLAGGLVKGKLIECPKHNGRFDITDGSPQRAPACVALRTYGVRVTDGDLWLDLSPPGGCGAPQSCNTYSFRVVSNENVATYIKELVLEPLSTSPKLSYRPGDYLQLNIPAYGEIQFKDMDVAAPYADTWKAQHVFELKARNAAAVRRNYSLATNPSVDRTLRFNVRIATPPRGQACDAGIGSSYIFSLKPGHTVTGVGPFGNFHIKETSREMVYLGGGAGMAPLRAHISHLFDTLKTNRKVSFWYGARSLRELFYQDYFNALADRFPNFSFHVALSEPQPTDLWRSPVGFIHEVVRDEYLKSHADLAAVEFYLCGPPVMIKAGSEMLRALNVCAEQIAFDEFS
jgi:MocE subfamily Rieske [2Fe-2S] domain protein